MKKNLLFVTFLTSCFTAAYAQPTLTAATTNPLAGEMFIGHMCDNTGVSEGAAGPSVTWNFATLTDLGFNDTTGYFTCLSTPYCDSFTGSNIVAFDGTDYVYEIADASGFSIMGAYSGMYVHLTDPKKFIFYPATYTNTHLDSFAAVVPFLGTTTYISGTDSFNCDAYGTLILPSGTYTNVLRVHTTTITKDSTDFMGTPLVNEYQTETYSWFKTGFHNPLLVIDLDTAGSTTLDVVGVRYYTFQLPLAANGPAGKTTGMQVYPNPATDVINVRFSLTTTNAATITLTDLMGRVVRTVPADELKQGANSIAIPTAGLPQGMYVLRLQSAGATLSEKVMINR